MRIGYSWPTGSGRRMWVSLPFWAWLLVWLLALGPLLVWWTVKALIWVTVAIAGAVRAAHSAPAVPSRLRSPPSRRR